MTGPFDPGPMPVHVKRKLATLALLLALAPLADLGPTVHEDTPAWNCHTMGNRICGNQRTPAGVFPL